MNEEQLIHRTFALGSKEAEINGLLQEASRCLSTIAIQGLSKYPESRKAIADAQSIINDQIGAFANIFVEERKALTATILGGSLS